MLICETFIVCYLGQFSCMLGIVWKITLKSLSISSNCSKRQFEPLSFQILFFFINAPSGIPSILLSVIPESQIYIYVAADAVHMGCAAVLPDPEIIAVCGTVEVLREPFVILGDPLRFKIAAKHTDIPVDHRRISCCFYSLAESDNYIGPL